MSEHNIKPEITMVKSQVFTNKVTDSAVMAALEKISRDEFVPDNYHGVGCIDEDLPLGNGRYLMEPMVFARLLQLAQIKNTDHVLVIAPANGYPLAVISQLANRVIGIETDNINIALTQQKLHKLGINNVTMINGDLKAGHELLKPYDVIFINGAVETIPENLVNQLKTDGCLVTVKVDPANPHEPPYAIIVNKRGKLISESKQFQAFTPKLIEFDATKKFDF